MKIKDKILNEKIHWFKFKFRLIFFGYWYSAYYIENFKGHNFE